MERDRLMHLQSDTRCLACFALEGEPARVEPHEAQHLAASETLRTGTREEFSCSVCGQRMARFLSNQTSPPPTNKWRCERQTSVPAPHELPAAVADPRMPQSPLWSDDGAAPLLDPSEIAPEPLVDCEDQETDPDDGEDIVYPSVAAQELPAAVHKSAL